MKLVVLADTHGEHESVIVPEGDAFIHAGDFTRKGGPMEIERFLVWFDALPHKHKIVVPGNHELSMCDKTTERIMAMDHDDETVQTALSNVERTKALIGSYSNNIHFLLDRGIVIDDISFYGTPYCNGDVKIMSNWAFYEPDTAKRAATIPTGVDILITHVPPFGVLDNGLGCPDLLERVNVIEPYLHVFGHVHENGGQKFFTLKTHFINAATTCVVHEL